MMIKSPRTAAILLVLISTLGIAACGGDGDGEQGADARVEETADDFDPQASEKPDSPRAPDRAEELQLSDLVSTAEFVDLIVDTRFDIDEFCESWGTARQIGAEDTAFERFVSEFPGDEGFSAREVFDELTSRC